jgi:hypothetical protein
LQQAQGLLYRRPEHTVSRLLDEGWQAARRNFESFVGIVNG